MPVVDKWVVPEPIYQFLSSTGKGGFSSGTDALGDYSTATGSSGETFHITPSTGEAFFINRMFVHVQDTGAFAAEEYGNLGSALTNGVQIRVQTDTGTILDLTDVTVKANAQWARHAYDVRIDTWSVGDEFLTCRWSFYKNGYPIRLDGDNNERLEVYLQDSCTGLVEHNFFVNGYKEDAAYDLRQ